MKANRDGFNYAAVSQSNRDQITQSCLIALGESYGGIFYFCATSPSAETHDRRPESILGDTQVVGKFTVAQRTARCRSSRIGGPVWKAECGDVGLWRIRRHARKSALEHDRTTLYSRLQLLDACALL